MTNNEKEYIKLRLEAARQFRAKHYREAQIAINIAFQMRPTDFSRRTWIDYMAARLSACERLPF